MRIQVKKDTNDFLEELTDIKYELEKIRQDNIELADQIEKFKGILLQYGIMS